MSLEPMYPDRAIKRQNLRVIIASEYAETRRFLRKAVEGKAETTVVGEAENIAKALALARGLRPNIAVIDVRLPHVVGFVKHFSF